MDAHSTVVEWTIQNAHTARILVGSSAGNDGVESDTCEVYVDAGPPLVPLEEIRRKIREHVQGTSVLRAILFGSFARGEADLASDVDLVLIEPTAAPLVERGRRHLALFQMGVGLDLLVYTPEECERLKREGNPFIERVEREGATVYARPEG